MYTTDLYIKSSFRNDTNKNFDNIIVRCCGNSDVYYYFGSAKHIGDSKL